jgi:hypothetical protein
MRVNIYGEELTDKVELIKKAVDQKTFYGLRLYLKSHPDLHHSVSDNDESAVTLWLPYTKVDGHDFTLVANILESVVSALEEAKTHYISSQRV